MLPGLQSPALARVFRAILVVSAAACFTECRASGGPSTTPTPLVLAIGTSIPRAGDAGAGVNEVVRSLTLEGPVAIGGTGRPIPREFDSWRWETQSRTLRLHVRPGVTFHDGTPLTSAIAAEILRSRFFDAKKQTVLSTSVISVQAGDSEVLVRTAKPEGFLISDIAGIPFGLPGLPRVGVGPFVYAAEGPPIELQAFDHYHVGRPAIDRIRISEYDTHRAAWAAMMRGEINMLFDVARDAVDFVQAESTVQSFSFLRPYYYAMVFNQRHSILRRKEVRQALNEAVDRDALVKTTLHGRGLPASGPIWPEHWAYSSTSQQYKFNPDAARLRFDAIGLTPRASAAPGRMPSRLRFNCLVIAEDERFQRTALVVQKQLSDIGVDMEISVQPLAGVRESLAVGSFDAVLFEFAASRALGFVYSFWHSPQPGSRVYVNTGYASADAALDRLRAAIDDDEVRVAVGDVQRVFFEDPPALFLTWPETTRAVSREFVVPNDGPRDIMGSVRQWRPAPPPVAGAR